MAKYDLLERLLTRWLSPLRVFGRRAAVLSHVTLQSRDAAPNLFKHCLLLD
jgi:hypothetical protein